MTTIRRSAANLCADDCILIYNNGRRVPVKAKVVSVQHDRDSVVVALMRGRPLRLPAHSHVEVVVEAPSAIL